MLDLGMFKILFPIPKNVETTSIEYNSYRFIYSFSWIFLSVLIFFVFSNIFHFHYYQLAVVEFLSILVLIAILQDLRKNENIQRTSYFFVSLIIVLIAFINYYILHEPYALIWNIFVPISSFYLLGNKRGSVVLSLYLLYFSFFLFTIDNQILSFAAKENFILAYLILCIGLYAYETTRYTAYKKINAILKIEHQYALELETLSTTDKLTQIYNRLKLDELLELTYKRAQRYDEKFSIVLIDIDYFKEVNDRYGHLVGDEVLIAFTQLITKNIRSSDYFGRWGGEEFMLILPNTSLQMALNTAANLREIIEQHPFEYKFSNTASFGVATFNNEDDLLELVNRSDKALYKAKNSGRNSVTSL